MISDNKYNVRGLAELSIDSQLCGEHDSSTREKLIQDQKYRLNFDNLTEDLFIALEEYKFNEEKRSRKISR